MQNLRATAQEYYDEGLVDGFNGDERKTNKYESLSLAYNHGYDIGVSIKDKNDFIPYEVRLLPRVLWENIVTVYQAQPDL